MQLSDPRRITHDKAIILLIIKFLLIGALLAGLIYLGVRLLFIVIPFAVGFILARASLGLSGHLREPGAVSGAKTRSLNLKQSSLIPMTLKRACRHCCATACCGLNENMPDQALR